MPVVAIILIAVIFILLVVLYSYRKRYLEIKEQSPTPDSQPVIPAHDISNRLSKPVETPTPTFPINDIPPAIVEQVQHPRRERSENRSDQRREVTQNMDNTKPEAHGIEETPNCTINAIPRAIVNQRCERPGNRSGPRVINTRIEVTQNTKNTKQEAQVIEETTNCPINAIPRAIVDQVQPCERSRNRSDPLVAPGQVIENIMEVTKKTDQIKPEAQNIGQAKHSGQAQDAGQAQGCGINVDGQQESIKEKGNGKRQGKKVLGKKQNTRRKPRVTNGKETRETTEPQSNRPPNQLEDISSQDKPQTGPVVEDQSDPEQTRTTKELQKIYHDFIANLPPPSQMRAM